MFSSTTMALSINIPTAKAMPAKLMIFRFRPKRFMNMNVPMILIGIVAATIMVETKLLRKI